MDTLKKHKGLRTMIFCNTLEKCKYLFNILEKAGYKVTMLTSDLNTKRRSESYNKFDSGDYTIMVTTDIASRGLDIQSVVGFFSFFFKRVLYFNYYCNVRHRRSNPLKVYRIFRNFRFRNF
eukprot:TRINITY_DN8601_c0_g1_i1.p1 TRINITY_DN8601_c0_g1~~TRINITY_DN8601_c0_g1_i1.p1  ORF type:complete len:121 (+),score=9.79 TRINITY_DN8601_c0_g1_i1:294-656(+)